ncbi:MAG: diguanylate cyclase [Gemmatimonadales bacterium]
MVKAADPQATSTGAGDATTPEQQIPLQDQEVTQEQPFVILAGDGIWPGNAVEALLRGRGYRLQSVRKFHELMDLVHAQEPDLIVLGPSLKGGGDGLETCRTLREDEWLATTPIIYLHQGGRAEAALALEAGAWGAVQCPPDPELFIARVRNAVQTKRQANSAMRRGLIDPQTGCYNQAGLITRLAEEMLHARRRKEPLAVLMVALVPFPEGARTTGGRGERESGYRMAAGLLRLGCRRSDILARYREMEFGIVAPATGHDGSRKLVGRVFHAFEDTGAQEPGLETLPQLRPIVGVTARSSWPTEEETPETLIAEALEALMSAKKWGLGYWIYDQETSQG